MAKFNNSGSRLVTTTHGDSPDLLNIDLWFFQFRLMQNSGVFLALWMLDLTVWTRRISVKNQPQFFLFLDESRRLEQTSFEKGN
ncbi:4727_t:CDS:2 [Rhizophagus irregularis]|nr:4727_t:CDS:2 [Rhizophagus irregularis]